jgi:hypothetical protein
MGVVYCSSYIEKRNDKGCIRKATAQQLVELLQKERKLEEEKDIQGK